MAQTSFDLAGNNILNVRSPAKRHVCGASEFVSSFRRDSHLLAFINRLQPFKTQGSQHCKRMKKVVLDRRRSWQCRADNGQNSKKPRLSPAQEQRLRNLYGQEDEKTRAAMARKKAMEDEAAAEAGGSQKKQRQDHEATQLQLSRGQEQRESQERSQAPGGFLRLFANGSNTDKSRGPTPKNSSSRATGRIVARTEKQSGPPGAPPSGNRPINPFRMEIPSYLDQAAKSLSDPDQRQAGAEWDDWGHNEEDIDWEDPEFPEAHTESYYERRRRAWEGRAQGTPRDAFLRPMVDIKGARDRLGFDATRAALEIEDEFDENRWESQEALKYGGFLLGVPLLVGFTLSRLIADPFYEFVLAFDSNAFALSDRSKIEGAKEVRIHEMRLRMDAAIGRAPPLTEEEMQVELRREARHIAKEFKERNRQSMLNALSDSTTAALIFGILVRKTEGRTHFFRTLARFASGLSDTAKAFLIIAGTDILLGYHSEEGWTAALRLLSAHYGMEAEDGPIYIFVAIVPVVMDAIFKYWIFKGLNGQNPAAAATLRSMDRH